MVFYATYTVVRDLRGRRSVSVAAARHDAVDLIDIERWLHLFDEQRVQALVLPHREIVRLLEDYYGTVHFVAVVVVLAVLCRRDPAQYRLWRNALGILTALALVGFFLFPVMPPRLLPPSYHFVDTLRTVGGLWNFGSAPAATLSNQYAAFPSLHTAWSAWCALALSSVIRPWWGRVLLVCYPVLTVFCIVVTGNHYLADAAAGLAVLGIGAGAAALVERRPRVRLRRPPVR